MKYLTRKYIVWYFTVAVYRVEYSVHLPDSLHFVTDSLSVVLHDTGATEPREHSLQYYLSVILKKSPGVKIKFQGKFPQTLRWFIKRQNIPSFSEYIASGVPSGTTLGATSSNHCLISGMYGSKTGRVTRGSSAITLRLTWGKDS